MTIDNREIAAIDLGSNSFHMAVASVKQGEVRFTDRLGEKVQLAAGINSQGAFEADTIERALACIDRFSQRLHNIDKSMIQVVGTDALRVAKNGGNFIAKAEQKLGARIEIISGLEEARLIYLGVSHTLADDDGRRLVIDIGGGSTEFIIGERFEPLERASLHMGCVSFRERFFKDGKITKIGFHKAVVQAEREIMPIKKIYKKKGWEQCVGASGSIKAIFQALEAEDGIQIERLSYKRLKTLRDQIIELGHIDNLNELNIKKERLSIFPAGLAILMGAFKALKIKKMEYTQGALREGLLYDMLGRLDHEDVRDRSISALQQRYGADIAHGDYVADITKAFFRKAKTDWQIDHPRYEGLLTWASKLFEIGLAIAHSQYHRHGAYLVANSDLAGFSKRSQEELALLVRAHRRKIPLEDFERVDEAILKLTLLFRIAVLFASDRKVRSIPFHLEVSSKSVHLAFKKGWLEKHPLTVENLEIERNYLRKIGFELSF
ncbi:MULTISPECIES: hypothetical protein [unclassified Oleiphilus]|nr:MULTISPECIES: hypothetical protein [unclassified Oleiphilus]KZY62772.1 hypothetical protein A3738_12500 [Oleiphilus sp. HI0066]KZY71596.1 hypothetical protein A3739_04180 [Oleiphilus sp. HI0067]